MERQVKSKKTYTIEVIEYTDDSSAMNRTNRGFNALELLGMFEFIRKDIHKQLDGDISPDVVTRTVVKDAEPNI